MLWKINYRDIYSRSEVLKCYFHDEQFNDIWQPALCIYVNSMKFYWFNVEIELVWMNLLLDLMYKILHVCFVSFPMCSNRIYEGCSKFLFRVSKWIIFVSRFISVIDTGLFMLFHYERYSFEIIFNVFNCFVYVSIKYDMR